MNYFTWNSKEYTNETTNSMLLSGFLTAVTHFTELMFEGRFQRIDLGQDTLVVTKKEVMVGNSSVTLLIGGLVETQTNKHAINTLINQLLIVIENHFKSEHRKIELNKELEDEINRVIRKRTREVTNQNFILTLIYIMFVHLIMLFLVSIDYQLSDNILLDTLLNEIIPLSLAIYFLSISFASSGGIRNSIYSN